MSLYLQVLPKVCHMGPDEIRDLSNQLFDIWNMIKHDALETLADDIYNTINELDRHYNVAIKDQEIAEENAKYREDRPNA